MDLQATVEYNLRNCKEKPEGGEERETGANEVSRNKKTATTYSPIGMTVPSALLDLTSLFEMGRGVPQRYSHLFS